MMTNLLLRMRLAGLFLGLALIISACGDATSAPIKPVFEGQPIRVGLLHSLTGTLALSEIPVRNAALLAINELNARGGVLGRKVVPLVADGQSDPAIFAEEAQRLIENQGVTTIFGCWTSACRRAVQPFVERNNAQLWYPVQYEGLEQSPNIVYLGATANQQLIPAVEYLFGQGKRRFYLVGSDYLFPRTANQIMRAQIAALGGEVVGESYAPLGANEFRPIIAAIRDSSADIIINTLNGDSNVAFFRQLRAAGFRANQLPVMSMSIAEPEIRAIGVELAEGHFATWNYFQSLDSPNNQRFVAAYRSDYGSQQVVSDPMAAMYAGVYLWAAAVERAGSFEREAVLAAASAIQLEAPEGPIRLDPESQHIARIARIGQIDSTGQFREVWRSEQAIAPDPFLRNYPWARTIVP